MGKKDAALHGLSKKERKALEEKEAAIAAELDARAAKPVKPKKGKGKNKSPDLTTLKRKALKQLIADKTNGELRDRAKAELKRRDAEGDASEARSLAIMREHEDAKAAKAIAKKEAAVKVKPAKKGRSTEADKAADIVTDAAEVKGETHSPAAIIEAADKVLADPNASEGALKSARTARNKALASMTDDELKARVQSKNANRAELEATANSVDRDDESAVAAYNAALAAIGGGKFLTSNAEKAARDAEIRGGTDHAAIADANMDANPTYAKPKKDKAAKVAEAVVADMLAVEAPAQAVEEVETETGRIFAAGESVDEATGEIIEARVDPADERGFALPSEGGRPDFEQNGNGQYKIKRLSDGKIVGYTRATTFISTNEDRTQLEKWKLRVLLEGIAINDSPDEHGRISDPVMAKVSDLIHRRDVAIAKARKADRKGKLVPGQFGTITEAAWSEFKKALNTLAEDLLELGGAHVKAAKGTELHELTELYDRDGIDAVGDLVTAGKITHADLADVEAYARAIEAAGIKIIPEFIEQPIVVEDLKVAGRLDRVVMVRLPGSARAIRCIFDVKSGRIDLGAGKIAQQLSMYARGETYNLETHERGKHGASLTKGLVLHLVPGSAEAHIYVVDLGTGRIGNDLSTKVRAFRNDGKRAIDMTVDLAAPKAAD